MATTSRCAASRLWFHEVRAVRPKAPALTDISTAVRDCFESIRPVTRTLPAGAKVAITAGSRGVDRIGDVLREVVRGLREAGASPFIIPSMGSHGGATAEGQERLLAHYGVTEKEIGAPVISCIETVPVGQTASGIDVYMDRLAYECGRVFVVNRVKPHTDFDGAVESGLLKMIAVGLGKLQGAATFHPNALRRGYEATILEMSRCSIASGKILAGLGVVENDRHVLCDIGAAPSAEIEVLDRRLQARAQELYPRLPFTSLDLLIVDELGKNVSGAGMDAKVIGRPVHPDLIATTRERIKIKRIYVRDLTAESEGNAAGIGFADLMHERIAGKIDFRALYMNAGAGVAPNVARMPMHCPTDLASLDLLALNMGFSSLDQPRIAWIRNTLAIGRFRASPQCVEDLAGNPDYSVDAATPFDFDETGNLPDRAPGAEGTNA
jgi:hypothetical protein